MMVSHSIKAYSGFCFACNNKPFEMKGKQTLEELAELKRINNEQLQRTEGQRPTLPDDFTRDIPLEGRLWLYSNGITARLSRQYNIGYSERLRRVVLPVYNSKGTLIWFQCRALLDGQKPKYLQPSGDKSSVVFESKQTSTSKSHESVVVVEDIMSAIRVGEVNKTVSLLGTKADTAQINHLSNYDTVITWLDADKAGRRGSKTIRQAVGLLTDTRDICTARDPKQYSKEQIEELLSNQ
jgi:DNA primase